MCGDDDEDRREEDDEDEEGESSLMVNSSMSPLNTSHTNSAANSSAAAAAAATAYNQKLFVCSICDAKFHVVDHINDHFLKNHYNEYHQRGPAERGVELVRSGQSAQMHQM